MANDLDVASGGTTAAKKVDIAIDIYSDNICPFCYLGYKKLLAAIDQVEKEKLPVAVSMRFKPFMLDPTLPCDHPVSKKERYAAKFGDRAPAIFSSMQERGKPWGINFKYEGPIRNTYNSHRFVEKAYDVGGEKTQRAFIEKIFAGYFENEQDIGCPDFLAKSAVEAGVFAEIDEALDFAESDELKGETCSSIRKTQSLGISGVPFTVINSKYAVSGAQEPDAFVDIFRKIAHGQCPCKQPNAKS